MMTKTWARPGRVLAGLAILLVVCALGAGLAACGGSGGDGPSPSPADERATVPDVAADHLLKDQAEAQIRDAGLVPVVQTATSMDVPAGGVIEQSPAAGEQVARSSEVVISVSLGPKMIALPDFKGMTAKEVGAFLNSHRLVGKEIQAQTVKVDKGLCYKQSPGPGDQTAQGSTVTYWVCSGKPVVTVPDLKGMTESQAQAALNKKNLTYAGQKAKYSSTVKKGLVVSQTVPAGTEVVTGTSVEVYLSKGPHSTLLTVPQCVGQQKNDVLPDLRLDGFQNIVVDMITSSKPAGVVVKQKPTAGTRIHPTEQVILYVSKGGGGGTLLTVPKCIGEQKNDVLPDLRLDGFNNIRTEDVESGRPAGTVVRQIPEAGVKIHPDDPLILYISAG
jgi:beta-lactam-binding protein with PASTA domain